MPLLAVKSLDSSTRALAGSQAAQQRVRLLSWGCELPGTRAPAAATAVAARSVFHLRISFLPILDSTADLPARASRVSRRRSLRHRHASGETDINYTELN